MSDWISVKDRLPGYEVNVLVFVRNHDPDADAPVYMAIANINGNGWFDAIALYFLDDVQKEVTHWMPLPEPPVTK